MKVKLFVARKIQYFELGVFSFYSYVYYLTRGFIASTRPFNLLTRAFHPPTRAFGLPTRAFNLATRVFSLLTRGSEFVTRGLELVTRRFELVTLNSCLLLHVYLVVSSRETQRRLVQDQSTLQAFVMCLKTRAEADLGLLQYNIQDGVLCDNNLLLSQSTPSWMLQQP